MSKPKINFRETDLVFFDLETTGLTASYHEIIEIGAVRYSQTKKAVVNEFSTKVIPVFLEIAEPEALKVNGYSPEKWEGARSAEVALLNFSNFVAGAIPAGHNTQFDLRFLHLECISEGLDAPPFADYRCIDTVSMLWPLVQIGRLETPSLEAACQYFGIPIEGQHEALADAKRALSLYLELEKFYHDCFLTRVFSNMASMIRGG